MSPPTPQRLSTTGEWPVPHGDVPCPEHLDDVVVATPLVALGREAGLVRIPGIGRVLVNASGPIALAVDSRDPRLPRPEVAAVTEPSARALSLLLAGRFPLRGAAAEVDGRALVVLGAPHTGATAVVAALTRRGRGRLLADRHVVIDGDPPTVEPTAGSVDLWPAELDDLAFGCRAGTPVRASLPVRRVPLPCAAAPVPVGLVVDLHQDIHVDEPMTDPVSGFDALGVLVRHAWHGWAIAGAGASPRQMAWGLGVVRSAPVARITVERRSDGAATTADLLVRLLDEVGRPHGQGEHRDG